MLADGFLCSGLQLIVAPGLVDLQTSYHLVLVPVLGCTDCQSAQFFRAPVPTFQLVPNRCSPGIDYPSQTLIQSWVRESSVGVDPS